MRKHSVKNERLNSLVQREIARIIRDEVKDPRIPLMLSVVAAEVAPDLKACKVYISVLGDEDLKACKVYISVLGDEKSVSDCGAALKSASGYIRRELAHNLNLRLTPALTFFMDQSIEYGVNMSHRIDLVMEEQNERAAEREAAEQAAAEAGEEQEEEADV